MLEKLVFAFIAPLARTTFTFQERTFVPRPLTVSPQIFRRFSCPSHCGACCIQGDLEWLPNEKQVDYGNEEQKTIEFDGRRITVVIDRQRDARSPDNKCRHLDRATGRCGIHTLVGKVHPMLCDTVPLRSSVFSDDNRGSRISSELPGRLWALKRIDGEKGGQCSLNSMWDESDRVDLVRRLNRLRDWILHLGADTWIDDVIEYVQSGPHTTPLRRNVKESQ